eukprot:scaffold68432_cov61-Phaeocystis_antarctica.AAC.4
MPAPWPRDTAARPPRGAPRLRASNRGCSTPRPCRASGRWPRGSTWLPCASPTLKCTLRPQPAAHRTRRPTTRPAGPVTARPRGPAAAPPRHSQTSSAASSASCEKPRAAAKRQGLQGSPCRT